MYTLMCYVDEEDYAMQKPQPDPIMPPRARMSQFSPRQVVPNRQGQRAATPKQFIALPRTPMPQQKAQGPSSYNAPRFISLPLSQLSPVQRQYAQRQMMREVPIIMKTPVTDQISPVISLPANLQRPPGAQYISEVPVTPPVTPGRVFMQGAREWSPLREGQEESRRSSPGIPVTPPCSIPGYFAKGEEEGSEPGVGETLMGCGMLLLMGLVVVAVLYYLMI